MPQRPPPPSTDLTDQQRAKLSEVLSGYDAKALTDDHTAAIAAQIKDLGIAPGRGLTTALTDAGFDARTLTAALPKDGPPPAKPEDPGPGSVDKEAVARVVKILESYDSAGEGGDVWSDLFEELDASGIDSAKPIVDFYS